MFAHLKKEAEMKVPRRHVELYDTIMGCLGYTSPNGGINETNNWCKLPDNSAKAAQQLLWREYRQLNGFLKIRD